MKVLIIDDSQTDRDLILKHLEKIEKREIKADECTCLKDGQKKLESFNYDAIILDLSLPESDGIDTVETIVGHLNKHNKNTPIIILTGSDDYSVGRQAWLLGIKNYLIKDEIESKDLSRALTFATLNSKKSIAI